MVLWSLENLNGGEILVPKLDSYKVLDLAKAIGPECKIV
jgi:FlaA1/EpsC-like NDP-sugar epimerase